jgi:hypothetical protein
MKLPICSPELDLLRITKMYPVDQVRSVKVDEDSTIVIELDCLDDWPTNAIVGMSRQNAELLVARLQLVLHEAV